MANQPEMNIHDVAQLARISLSEEEAAAFQEQLGIILNYVEQLAELDVEGVEPMAHPHGGPVSPRPDEVRAGLDRGQFLQNAPDGAQDQLRVPKVVEDA